MSSRDGGATRPPDPPPVIDGAVAPGEGGGHDRDHGAGGGGNEGDTGGAGDADRGGGAGGGVGGGVGGVAAVMWHGSGLSVGRVGAGRGGAVVEEEEEEAAVVVRQSDLRARRSRADDGDV
ncbi:MAG: hypothetical protein ACE367_15295 [Acidimicrobiales bacterium]